MTIITLESYWLSTSPLTTSWEHYHYSMLDLTKMQGYLGVRSSSEEIAPKLGVNVTNSQKIFNF